MIYKNEKRAETVARMLNTRSGYPLARAFETERGWEIMSSYAFGVSYGTMGEEASTAASLAAMTDADLQHHVDCQNDADLMGNAWGKSLEAEQIRRDTQRRADGEAAEATANRAAQRILRQAEMDSDGNGVVWNARMYLADRARYMRLSR